MAGRIAPASSMLCIEFGAGIGELFVADRLEAFAGLFEQRRQVCPERHSGEVSGQQCSRRKQ